MKYCEFCEAIYPPYTRKCSICKRDLEELDKKFEELVKEEIRKI